MFTTTMMVPKPACKRGDVVLVLFPTSDLRTAKTRPALVVQTDNLLSGLSQVIIAMISSQTSRANHPSRVMIVQSSAQGLQSGLLSDSVVMTDNLATVVNAAIHRVIGSIPMEEVDTSLRHTLGL